MSNLKTLTVSALAVAALAPMTASVAGVTVGPTSGSPFDVQATRERSSHALRLRTSSAGTLAPLLLLTGAFNLAAGIHPTPTARSTV